MINKFLGMLCVALSAQANAADLMAIYREAREADAVYASARAAYDAGREKLPQGLAGLLPALTLSANTQFNDRNLQFRNFPVTSNDQYNSNAVTFTATQPLLRMQNWITYEQ